MYVFYFFVMDGLDEFTYGWITWMMINGFICHPFHEVIKQDKNRCDTLCT